MADRCFIIAEIGINHNGSLSLAKDLVLSAKDCGVDAVKFQTFKAQEFISDPSLEYTYQSQGKEITESQIDMFKRYEFSKKEWKELVEFCNSNNIICFTTPQNKTDLDFILDVYEPPLIKVGSDDLTNLELLKYYASKNIPMIISTGMSYEREIADAIGILKQAGLKSFTVLHCISSYPAQDIEVNMRKMLNIKKKFNVNVGFSDHTSDELASIIAVSNGAKVVEKHFTLDHDLPGPDHRFSANPAEMRRLVDAVRRVELLMGTPQLIPTENEIHMRQIARRSIVVSKDLPKGHVLCREDLGFKRPGTGIAPKKIEDLLGRVLRLNKKENDTITYEDLEALW